MFKLDSAADQNPCSLIKDVRGHTAVQRYYVNSTPVSGRADASVKPCRDSAGFPCLVFAGAHRAPKSTYQLPLFALMLGASTRGADPLVNRQMGHAGY